MTNIELFKSQQKEEPWVCLRRDKHKSANPSILKASRKKQVRKKVKSINLGRRNRNRSLWSYKPISRDLIKVKE